MECRRYDVAKRNQWYSRRTIYFTKVFIIWKIINMDIYKSDGISSGLFICIEILFIWLLLRIHRLLGILRFFGHCGQLLFCQFFIRIFGRSIFDRFTATLVECPIEFLAFLRTIWSLNFFVNDKTCNLLCNLHIFY